MSSDDNSSVEDPYATDGDDEYLPERDLGVKTQKVGRHNLQRARHSCRSNKLTFIEASTSGQQSIYPNNTSQTTENQRSDASSVGTENLQEFPEFSDDVLSDGAENQTGTTERTPHAGKKRKIRKSLWQRNVRKAKRTAGARYKNTKGEEVAEKHMGAGCNCKNRCFEKVGEECCKKIFSDFYLMSSKDLQDSYLYGLLKRVDVSRQRPRSGEGKPKSSTFSYEVKIIS